MKNLPSKTRPVAAVLLATLLAAPLALQAADDAAQPTQPAAPVVTDVATIDLNRADAVNLRLQTTTVTESVEVAFAALQAYFTQYV
ncbi:MAG: hypothetical protein H7067_11860 [Burkholderiales bacterium]|nr:hypothetical protein [Opitutaceae bacterium]